MVVQIQAYKPIRDKSEAHVIDFTTKTTNKGKHKATGVKINEPIIASKNVPTISKIDVELSNEIKKVDNEAQST